MEQLQNLEIEQQILGLTIANKKEFEKIEDLIKSEHFSIEFHQKLFERITEIRKTTIYHCGQWRAKKRFCLYKRYN